MEIVDLVSTAQYTLQRSEVQCSAAMYHSTAHITAQRSTVQHSAAKCSAAQHSATKHAASSAWQQHPQQCSSMRLVVEIGC